MQYLASRREGLFDWIVFHRPTRRIRRRSPRRIGLDPSKPVIGLLDQRHLGRAAALPGQRVPEHARVAGADVRVLRDAAATCSCSFACTRRRSAAFRRRASRSSRELRKRVPQLAPNIIVVPPESDMSTYALMSLCNAAIIYGTKMGVELTSVGLPVIVAGEAWIRNKGLTHDASSPEEYFRILEQLPFPERLGPAQLARARRYAYHFFFNRMIPLPFIEPKAGYPIYRLKLDALQQLLPGESRGLDTICDGILERQPFVLRDSDRGAAPAELVDVVIGVAKRL